MSLPETGIRPLPSDVAAKIKSSTSITHLNGVIIDLVKNALDAKAHTVHVSVDFKRGSCMVEDDGEGIPTAEFESSGGLGKAHHTSKYHARRAYGHQGLFLSSLASLSLLTITSRHVHQRITSSMLLHQSKVVARLIPAPAHYDLQLADHGTCVTANNLFGNMPVRVKSRALSLEKPDELEREWDSLRYSLVSLMLANSRLQNLVISDKQRGKRISVRLRARAGNGRVMPRNGEVDLERIGSILAQSSLINARDMSSWHIVSAALPDLAVRAAISTIPGPSKRLQFISLNDNPVLSQNSSNVLFQEINQLFSCSDFGNSDSKSLAPGSTCPSHHGVGSDGLGSASGSNWTRPVCKWPMFYIRIDTSSTQAVSVESDEVSPDSEKSIQRITDVLGVLIVEFLRQEGLRPRMMRGQGSMSETAQRTTTSDTSQRGIQRLANAQKQNSKAQKTEESLNAQFKLPSFQRSSPAVSGPNFNNWSRVKVAKGVGPDTSVERHESFAIHENEETLRQHPARRRVQAGRTQHPETRAIQASKPHENQILALAKASPTELSVIGDGVAQISGDDLIPWVDPRSGKKHMISSRTGQTVERSVSDAGLRIWPGSFARASRQLNLGTSAWVDDLLNAWENPAFNRTEQQVSSLDIGSKFWDGHDSHACLHGIATLDVSQVAKFRGKLQRHSLAAATIIAQVDQKFILAKLRTGPTQLSAGEEAESALVLIDQHAADERRRVEQLFDEMFIPLPVSQHPGQVRTLEIYPITFGVSATESDLFCKYMGFFAEWGIRYDASTEPGTNTVISVRTLPVLIAERCRLEPSVLIDLLRREIWASEEDHGRLLKQNPKTRRLGKTPASPDEVESSFGGTSESNASPSWVQRMSRCPQGIIDLLNSRACRGAIMFNDRLSIEECKTLVSRLASCVFPYQCAHGRPSIVPLLDLRSSGNPRDSLYGAGITVSGHDDEEDSALGFAEAFRRQYVQYRDH